MTMRALLPVTAPVMGVVLRCRLVEGALVLLGGRLAGWALPGRLALQVADAAAQVQDLVNRLGALSGAAGVYLVPRLPVPAPTGSPGEGTRSAQNQPIAAKHRETRTNC